MSNVFEKAFDTVRRVALWYKLLLNNINEKMYNVILNMYNDVKSCINYNNCKSAYFSCDIGVRQGENLLPFLFALSEKIEVNLNIYLKLFVLLYADDTVIMAESREDLQAQLNVFGEYCKKWKLKVNAEKNKNFHFF